MTQFHLAWWNLENLFDTEDSPDRSDKLRKHLATELKGWTAELLEQKLVNLAAVISAMNSNRGPDILGVCEVENKRVLEQLLLKLEPLGRDYGIIHHDCADERGIDIAFIYDRSLFTMADLFAHSVVKRSSTRDILQITFTIKTDGTEFILIGNHWPSRSAGVRESEPYRIVAAETLSYWIDQIPEHKGNIPIIVMGDFNDNPFDLSLTGYALACGDRGRVIRARSPRLLNLMWPLMANSHGSFFFDGEALIFDQILINKRCLEKDSPIRIDPNSARIYAEFRSLEPKKQLVPEPFGRPTSKLNPTSTSDHFPISCEIDFQR